MGPIAAIVVFGIVPVGVALFMLGFFVVSILSQALSGVPVLAFAAWGFLAGTLLLARVVFRRLEA